MFCPDLTRTSETDPTFPPHCSAITVVRKPPGATFLWTCVLGWDLDDESISKVNLPPPFSRDRGDILAAYDGTGPVYRRSFDPRSEIEVSVDVRVGETKLPIVAGASAIVKRIAMVVAEGSATVKALLRIEAPRSLAPEMLDLIDADVDVRVITNGELPFAQGDDADTEPGDLEEEVDLDAEAAGAPPDEDRSEGAPVRRRKQTGSIVEDLPPEPEPAEA